MRWTIAAVTVVTLGIGWVWRRRRRQGQQQLSEHWLHEHGGPGWRPR